MEPKSDEHSSATAVSFGPGAISQIRQLSIPLWARSLALVLAVTTLVAGILLVLKGWMSCTSGCEDRWIESGTALVAATFLPAVVLVYLVFAETGVSALVAKTGELLKKVIPEALCLKGDANDFEIVGNLASCMIETVHVPGSPRARYRVTAYRGGETAELNVVLDLNVSKANVVFYVPANTEDDQTLIDRFKATIEGARHEGYQFDKVLTSVVVDGRRLTAMTARQKLSENFLWDPAKKLHFAQDLRMFIHSFVLDGWSLLKR